jgi:hypothetical protein
LYDPCELVVVEVELPVSTLFKVTEIPDTTAAAGSVTTPAMSPVVAVCAPTLVTANTTSTNINAIDVHTLLVAHLC